MKRIIFLFFIAGEFFTSDMFAQTCCSGGVPLANNIGGLPVSSKGTWQVSVSTDLNILRTLKDGSAKLEDNSRERKTLSLLVKSSYSFTDKIFLEGLFSWVQQDRTIEQIGGFNDFDRTQGLGDWVVLFNYKYFNHDGWTLIAGTGPKFPTGQSDIQDENGLTLNADLQPGSGAWDGIFIHRLVKVDANKKSRSYFSNFTYRTTGKNRKYLGGQTYQFGTEWQVSTGVSDQAVVGRALLSYGFNLRFRVAGKDQFNEQLLPNTGGKFLFIMPVVGWYIRPNVIISMNSELPIITHAEGTQLVPTLRVNVGLYFSFGQKHQTFK